MNNILSFYDWCNTNNWQRWYHYGNNSGKCFINNKRSSKHIVDCEVISERELLNMYNAYSRKIREHEIVTLDKFCLELPEPHIIHNQTKKSWSFMCNICHFHIYIMYKHVTTDKDGIKSYKHKPERYISYDGTTQNAINLCKDYHNLYTSLLSREDSLRYCGICMYMVNVNNNTVEYMWDMWPNERVTWNRCNAEVYKLCKQFYFQIPEVYLYDPGEDPETHLKWIGKEPKSLDRYCTVPTKEQMDYIGEKHVKHLFSVRALYKTPNGISEYPGDISSHVHQYNAILAANKAYQERLKDPELDFKPFPNGGSIRIDNCQGFYGIRVMQHSTFKTIYTIKVEDEERRQMVSHQKNITLRGSTRS